MPANQRERGAVLGVFLVFLVLLGMLSIPYLLFGRVVPPNAIGLRQYYFGLPYIVEEGLKPQGLVPGLHWQIPKFSQVHLLPRDFQFVHFNSKSQGGTLNLPVLDIPTLDGSKVKTDISLVLRFFERPSKDFQGDEGQGSGKALEARDTPADVPYISYEKRSHGGPKELIARYSLARDKQLSTFSDISASQLRKKLSALSTSDYYNPILREHGALEAARSINNAINPAGMELWGALIRRYIYAERSIDEQIFQKNLQDQKERLNSASNKLAEAQAETEKQSALWDAKIRDLKVQDEARAKVIRSEGELYEGKKVAEADLLVATAKAEVDRLRANALNEVRGADVYVAREMVPLLETLQGGVVSGLDPYDIDAWVRRLGAQQ